MTNDRTSQTRDYYNNSDRELGRRYLRDEYPEINREYIQAATAHRFGLYPNQQRIADFSGAKDKKVLEVGVGQGLDHLQFAKAGARLSGVDLTPRHCQISREVLRLEGYSSDIHEADACGLPFEDNQFDRVYSCGVLLLISSIKDAIAEIHRVLKPGGHATIMLYNRASLHYWIKSRFYHGYTLGEDKVLGKKIVDDWYTDGPGYVSVDYYAPSDLPELFEQFSEIDYLTDCLTPEQIPFLGLPRVERIRRCLETRFGFFLWVRGTK